ncbi:MAG: imidazolonepropionase [Candidatus Thermoplasmatota archaeon]|nr:imidazolonepropionase [Candidatus Thermoplasmatota archaeon]
MQKILCRELFTGKEIINDAFVVFDSSIVDLGKGRGEGYDCETIKADFVMPGFVDSHTHAVFAGSRERELEMKLEGKRYMEILRAGYGINRTVKDTTGADDDKILQESIARIDRAIEHGTTTMEVKCGYGVTMDQELRLLGLIDELKQRLRDRIDIVPTFLAHIKPYDGYAEELIEEMERIKGKAEFFDVFMDAFGYEDTEKLLERAKRLGLKLKLHADEFSDCGGIALAANAGCVSVDHLIKSSLDSFKALGSERSPVPCLLPATSFSSFEPYAKGAEIVAMGVPAALATDMNPNCWCENMGFVADLACYCMRMKPIDVLKGITLNGARALALKDRGYIAKGAIADLVITEARNHMDFFSKFGTKKVKSVIKRGKKVF